MNARDLVFTSIRSALGVTGAEEPRRKAVQDRLRDHPRGVIPKRGQRDWPERVALFMSRVEAVAGVTQRIASVDELPGAVVRYLRSHNLPLLLKCGADPRLASAPWPREPALTIALGPAGKNDPVAISYAYGAAAETGTLVLLSGPQNPTTLNFLPDDHIVVVSAETVAGDYETVLARLRDDLGSERLPRAINLVTGPSRSADIEQTLILGAHGPRRLFVVVVDGAAPSGPQMNG
jgi:L-lactate dehydrogenase complex protein LldG